MIRIARHFIIITIVVAAIVVIIAALFGVQSNILKSLLYGKQQQVSAKVTSPLLRLIERIPIPNVNGRIDHMAIDTVGREKLLFVAEVENNSLDVIDLNTGKRIHSISNSGLLNEPQGVVFIPEFDRIFVSNGQDGSVDIFDPKTFSLIKKVKLSSDDADNLRYDSNSKLVYVGYGEGAISILNTSNYNVVGDIKLTGHPESFQVEEQKFLEGKHRIFVNIPSSNSVVVVESKKHIVLATWPLTNAQNNFPMALDEANHRLFVGTRDPAKLLVFDTDSGKLISSLDIANDPDDIFYDAAKKRIYVSCGEGFINIFQQQSPNQYGTIANILTAAGARTSLFVPELNRFYLAVPHLGNQQSEILVYQVGQ
jgi:DNA-binding beta-propeller fold protein YncE